MSWYVDETTDAAVREAQQKIGRILAQLEEETGAVVSALELSKIDITQIEDNQQRLQMSVFIVLHRLPGHSWA